jgi:hypothetical protein
MFFKTLFATAACIVMTASIAAAQSPEIFVGYSNLQSEGLPDRNDPNWPFNTDFFSSRSTLHGVNASVSGYWSGIGLTGDFSFGRQQHTNTFTGGRDERHTDTLYFLAGPAIKFSQKTRVQPFARVMAGAAHTTFKVSRQFTGAPGTLTSSFDVGSTDFSASAGGGLDVRLGERTKLRVIQLDYAPIFLRDRTVQVLGNNGVIQPSTLDGQRQDNFRFSFGVTF